MDEAGTVEPEADVMDDLPDAEGQEIAREAMCGINRAPTCGESGRVSGASPAGFP
jgi:hypothetical protein